MFMAGGALEGMTDGADNMLVSLRRLADAQKNLATHEAAYRAAYADAKKAGWMPQQLVKLGATPPRRGKTAAGIDVDVLTATEPESKYFNDDDLYDE